MISVSLFGIKEAFILNASLVQTQPSRLQLYWNYISELVFSCKFAAYFLNNSS